MAKDLNEIQNKLGHFVRRFHLQELTHGIILSAALLLSVWLVLVAVAGNFYLSTNLRFYLFTFYAGFSALLLAWQVGLPLLHLFKLKRGISAEEASKLIGKFFPEIDDQLANVLSLSKNDPSNALVLASIQQKSKQFKPYNFLLAIPYQRVKLMAKIALIPIGVLVLALLWKPEILREGSNRIVAYEEEFIPENPFEFEVLNEDFEVFQGEDYPLRLKFKGKLIPKEVYIVLAGKKLRMSKVEDQVFSSKLHQVQQDVNWHFNMGGFNSKAFQLKVKYKPSITSFTLTSTTPSYLGGEVNKHRSGNIKIPFGSQLKWTITAKHSEGVLINIDGKWKKIDKNGVNAVAQKSSNYQIALLHSTKKDTSVFQYKMTVVPDEYPSIQLSAQQDSLLPGVHLFRGRIKDDHGFTWMKFVWSSKDTSGVQNLKVAPDLLQQDFQTQVNFNQLGLQEESVINYHFEVADNDGVMGPKVTRSELLSYSTVNKHEIDSVINQEADDVLQELSANLKKTQDLQKQFKDIKQLLLEQKGSNWSDQNKIKEFLKEQKKLGEDLMRLQKSNQALQMQKELLSPQEKELLEKQKMLDELFESLLDEETKKMFEELDKLMEELDKQNSEERLEQLNLNNENLEKSLDRMMELFKQMEFDQKLDRITEQLEQLADEQEKLATESKEAKKDDLAEIAEQQQKLQKEFQDLKKQLENLKQKNQALENERKFQDTQQEQNNVDQSMQSAQDQLQGKKKKKAAKQQSNAAEQMRKIQQKLNQMKSKEGGAQDAEDLATARQLLENLLYLSTSQEQLLNDCKKLSRFDPDYNKYIKQQQKLKADAKVIEDSLFALSKRQLSLAPTINKEIHEITFNTKKAIERLSDHQGKNAAVSQQYVMTSANNLALILDESIQNMQDAQMKQQFGQGSCNKPGGNKPKPGSSGMKDLKKMLAKQIEQMQKQLKKGNQPGKTGKKGEMGQAMQFGKMAAQQGAMKEKLRQIRQQLQQQGKKGQGELQQLQNEMEEVQKDLLNKRITPESVKRQQEILTRLLAAEKAMREREFEEKRESQEGKREYNRNPEDFLEYKKIEMSNEEMLKISLPTLNLFYKKKVNEYFNTLEE